MLQEWIMETILLALKQWLCFQPETKKSPMTFRLQAKQLIGFTLLSVHCTVCQPTHTGSLPSFFLPPSPGWTSLSCLEPRALQFKPVKCHIVVDKEAEEGAERKGLRHILSDSVINLYACAIIRTQNLNAWISCKNLFKNAITQWFRTPPVNLSLHKYMQHLHSHVWRCLLCEEGRKNNCASLCESLYHSFSL